VAAAKAASEQQQTTAQRQAGQTDHGPSVAALDDGHAFDQGSVPGERSVEVVGIDIQAPFQLRSSDDLQTPFTNYTSGYKALLDYVWIEEHRLKARLCSTDQWAAYQSHWPHDHLII
jgi:2',5'-phosphodiesterase